MKLNLGNGIGGIPLTMGALGDGEAGVERSKEGVLGMGVSGMGVEEAVGTVAGEVVNEDGVSGRVGIGRGDGNGGCGRGGSELGQEAVTSSCGGEVVEIEGRLLTIVLPDNSSTEGGKAGALVEDGLERGLGVEPGMLARGVVRAGDKGGLGGLGCTAEVDFVQATFGAELHGIILSHIPDMALEAVPRKGQREGCGCRGLGVGAAGGGGGGRGGEGGVVGDGSAKKGTKGGIVQE